MKREDGFEWLQLILDAHGVSQKEAAERIGENAPNFSRFLKGRRSLGPGKTDKLKAFCRNRFGLLSGDWASPPRPFAGTKALDEIGDQFFLRSSEMLVSGKWKSSEDRAFVERTLDTVIDTLDSLSERQIWCVLEPLSDYLHEKRDYVRWARWLRKAQASLAFASAGIDPLLLRVYKYRCTALAGEIARHEKFRNNRHLLLNRVADRHEESKEERELKDSLVSLKDWIRPNFEFAVDGLQDLIEELEAKDAPTGSRGRKSVSADREEIGRYARFCLVRAQFKLGWYLNWSSLVSDRVRSERLLRVARNAGNDLAKEVCRRNPIGADRLIGGARRVFHVQSCIACRLASFYSGRSFSSQFSDESRAVSRMMASKLFQESDNLAIRAIRESGSGIRERRNRIRTLSFWAMFLLDSHKVVPDGMSRLDEAKFKTETAADLLRELVEDDGDGGGWLIPDGDRKGRTFRKLASDAELAMRMYIEVRIHPDYWVVLPPKKRTTTRENISTDIADRCLPHCRRFFEIADAWRHLFGKRSRLYLPEPGCVLPEKYVGYMYEPCEGVQTPFYYATKEVDKGGLVDPFEGVDLASIPSFATQVDLIGKLVFSRVPPDFGAKGGRHASGRRGQLDGDAGSDVYSSKMLYVLSGFTKDAEPQSQPGARIWNRDIIGALSETIDQFRAAASQTFEAIDPKGSNEEKTTGNQKESNEANTIVEQEELTDKKKRATAERKAKELRARNVFAELSVLGRPDVPFTDKEFRQARKNGLLNRSSYDQRKSNETPFYELVSKGRESLDQQHAAFLEPAEYDEDGDPVERLVSVGLGFLHPFFEAENDEATEADSEPPIRSVRSTKARGDDAGPACNWTLRSLLLRWRSAAPGVNTIESFRESNGLSNVLFSKVHATANASPVPKRLWSRFAAFFGVSPDLFDAAYWKSFREKRERAAVEVLMRLREGLFGERIGLADLPDRESEERRQAWRLWAMVLLMCRGTDVSGARRLVAAETVPLLAASWRKRTVSLIGLAEVLRRQALFDCAREDESGSDCPACAVLSVRNYGNIVLLSLGPGSFDSKKKAAASDSIEDAVLCLAAIRRKESLKKKRRVVLDYLGHANGLFQPVKESRGASFKQKEREGIPPWMDAWFRYRNRFDRDLAESTTELRAGGAGSGIRAAAGDPFAWIAALP